MTTKPPKLRLKHPGIWRIPMATLLAGMIAVTWAGPNEDAVSAEAEGVNSSASGVSSSYSTTSITPRRLPPTDRFDFRGEHAGVIFTPGGYREINLGPGVSGYEFTPHTGGYGGYGRPSVYVPYYGSGHGSLTEPVALGASYEIVNRAIDSSVKPGANTGRRARLREVIVPGQYVQLYKPAVYEIGNDGREHLVEAEQTIRVPKVRIVIDALPGSAPASASAPAEPLQPALP